jgi:hypothetical protein
VTITYTPTLPVPQPIPTPPQPPSVGIAKPLNNAKYVKGQRVVVSYTCAVVLGNTLKSCSGPVPSGGTLNTTKAGTFSFKVTATTSAGLTAAQTVIYKVIAPSKKKGMQATVKLGSDPSFSGMLVGTLGTPKLAVPFKPCDPHAFVPCTSSSTSGSFSVRGRFSKKLRALFVQEVKKKLAAKGTVTVQVKSGSSTVTLSYTLSSPTITKFTDAAGKSPAQVTMHYKDLGVGTCKPAGSC